MEIETRRARIRVSTDGEVTEMDTPLRYRLRPGALRVLVPRRDSVALAEALSRVLDDRGAARAMGARGRAHVLARFEPAAIARQMAELWYATAQLAR